MFQLDIDLQCTQLRLLTENQTIHDAWQHSFQQWFSSCTRPPINFTLNLTTSTPTAPTSSHFYDPDQKLAVQQVEDGWHLTFDQLATICVQPARSVSNGTVTTAVLQNGRLLDITYTALAPHLRQQGIYLIHAFGAVQNGRCALIVGASGSGKTTAGLSLLQAGWSLLGNDTVMVSLTDGGVTAWPTPGHIYIRPHTIGLLGLNENGRFPLPHLAKARAKVTHLLFPNIQADKPTRLAPAIPATAFTRLMSESIDRWDTMCTAPHMQVLQRLCMQTAVYELQSGCDILNLANIIPV